MYSMSDYRAALDERSSYDMGTTAWKLAQMKVNSIVSVMMAAKDSQMVMEIVDEVYNLNDCGMNLNDEAI